MLTNTPLTTQDKSNPLEADCKFYVLLETSGSNKNHDREKLDQFLEETLNEGLVETGTVADSETQVASSRGLILTA